MSDHSFDNIWKKAHAIGQQVSISGENELGILALAFANPEHGHCRAMFFSGGFGVSIGSETLWRSGIHASRGGPSVFGREIFEFEIAFAEDFKMRRIFKGHDFDFLFVGVAH